MIYEVQWMPQMATRVGVTQEGWGVRGKRTKHSIPNTIAMCESQHQARKIVKALNAAEKEAVTKTWVGILEGDTAMSLEDEIVTKDDIVPKHLKMVVRAEVGADGTVKAGFGKLGYSILAGAFGGSVIEWGDLVDLEEDADTQRETG